MYRFENHDDYARRDIFAKQQNIQNALIWRKNDIEDLLVSKARCTPQKDKNELLWIAHDLQKLKAKKDHFINRKEEIEKELKGKYERIR